MWWDVTGGECRSVGAEFTKLSVLIFPRGTPDGITRPLGRSRPSLSRTSGEVSLEMLKSVWRFVEEDTRDGFISD